jgi:hypothetical protein
VAETSEAKVELVSIKIIKVVVVEVAADVVRSGAALAT